MVSWRRLAPMTATERGLKNRSIEAASARCSRLRHHARSRCRSASIGNSSVDHAVLVAADHAVAGVAEGLDHPLVVGQHLGDEPLDAALAAGLGEVLEQQLGDAAALVLVLDEEGDLGLAGLDHVVAADRDHLARQRSARTRPG